MTRSDEATRLAFARNALAVAVSTVLAGYASAAQAQGQEQTAAEAPGQVQGQEPQGQSEQTPVAQAGGAPTSPPQRDRQGDILEQVIVTARKRSENLQDIPQSVQAITETELTRGDVNGIDDAVRLIPSLSYVSYGPGTTKLIFRGVADSSVSFIADASAALYLDEQPLTQNSQNPDVQMIDIARVEALSGPQGSLYGSSAQSGTLRIITNAPDPTQFEASVGSSVRSGPESEMSYEIDAVLNLPLKEDKVALRLVGFDARDGGFIDNVLGTSGGGTKTNADVADDDFNRVDWSGGRATLLWNINDAWQLQTGAVFQYLDANSWQTYDANFGDLEVIRFHDEPHKDDWQQFHVTVQGDLGFADLISSSSYFTRDIEYSFDTTAYNFYLRTITLGYYASYDFGPDPTGFSFNDQETRRFAQEFRLSHAGERIQWIAGLFYERFHDQWNYDINIDNYEGDPSAGIPPTPSFMYWDDLYYDVFPGSTGNVSYNENNKTITTQYAVFGEVTFDFNEKWSMTTGGRWFDSKRDRTYFQEIPNNHIAVSDNPIATLRDFAPKLSFRYRFDDERMMYVLYSQGFRNGGANVLRPRSQLARTYEPDFLDNYELGLKSRWADGRVQINATAYHMVWKDYQVEVVDPGPLYAVGVENVGNAEINGLELDTVFAPTQSLEIGANANFLSSEATSTNLLVGTPDGARLPNTPEFKAGVYAEYTWPMQIVSGSGFVHVSYSYTGDQLNDIDQTLAGADPPLRMAPVQVTDLNIGIEGDTWDLSFSVDNVFDERGQIYRGYQVAHPLNDQSVNCLLSRNLCLVTVNRPREYGLSFTKRWGGG
jgi:outer membrane receptor protein involved in Fe transport